MEENALLSTSREEEFGVTSVVLCAAVTKASVTDHSLVTAMDEEIPWDLFVEDIDDQRTMAVADVFNNPVEDTRSIVEDPFSAVVLEKTCGIGIMLSTAASDDVAPGIEGG